MPDTSYSFPPFSLAHEARHVAVEAALEVIRAFCLGGRTSTTDATVNDLFKNLSTYADRIQAALKEEPS